LRLPADRDAVTAVPAQELGRKRLAALSTVEAALKAAGQKAADQAAARREAGEPAAAATIANAGAAPEVAAAPVAVLEEAPGDRLFPLVGGLLLALLVVAGCAAMLSGLRWIAGLRRGATPDEQAAAQGTDERAETGGPADDYTHGQTHSRQQAGQEQAESESGGVAAAPPQQAPWWDVLGVSRYAEMQDITARYRVLIRQYHPDRMVGLGPEIITMAEALTKALNCAIAEAREERANLREAEVSEFGTTKG